MIVLLMGVSGSGKTTVGRKLAEDLGWGFCDGDDLHPAANVAKMAAGTPLTDADRAPWLAIIKARIDDYLARGESAVIICSALREKYRQALIADPDRVKLIYLRGDYQLILGRLQQRHGHFMKAGMLSSQFAALEAPEHAVVIDIDRPIEAIVAEIKKNL